MRDAAGMPVHKQLLLASVDIVQRDAAVVGASCKYATSVWVEGKARNDARLANAASFVPSRKHSAIPSGTAGGKYADNLRATLSASTGRTLPSSTHFLIASYDMRAVGAECHAIRSGDLVSGVEGAA